VFTRNSQPRLFGGRDGGLWEWSDLSCHSLVGSFKIEFFFFFTRNSRVIFWLVVDGWTGSQVCSSECSSEYSSELIQKNLNVQKRLNDIWGISEYSHKWILGAVISSVPTRLSGWCCGCKAYLGDKNQMNSSESFIKKVLNKYSEEFYWYSSEGGFKSEKSSEELRNNSTSHDQWINDQTVPGRC
jgi:hypothetical protein